MSLLLAWLLLGADETAIVNARILTVTRGEIPKGTLLIRDGKIAELGPDVKVPAGATLIDAAGKTLFPGMLHPLSRLGTSGSGGAGAPQHQAADEIHPDSEALEAAARSGVTSFAVQTAATAWSGQAALLKPTGGTRESLLLEPGLLLRFGMQASTSTKDAFKQALEAARKAGADDKKKPEERDAVLIKVLKGELPLLVEVGGPGELLHFWRLLEGIPEAGKLRLVYAGPPELWKLAAELGSRKARVILRPLTGQIVYTRDRVNTAGELHRAGVQVAFAPLGDGVDALEGHRFRVAELVKLGFPREEALRALTILPAQFLGIESRVGSLEAGKDADLALYDRDPLDVPSRPVWVMIQGRKVDR